MAGEMSPEPQESIAYLSAQGWGLPFLRRAFASYTLGQWPNFQTYVISHPNLFPRQFLKILLLVFL